MNLITAVSWRYDRLKQQSAQARNSLRREFSEPIARVQVYSWAPHLREFLRDRNKAAIAPKYAHARNLYRIVRDRRPLRVLEYGSGVSTAVIAEALTQNGAGQLTSIDNCKEWADETMRTMPQSVAHCVRVLHYPVKEGMVGGVRVYRYGFQPTLAPDMIYLDGPNLDGDIYAAADLLDLEPSLEPRCLLLIDCRYEQTRFLQAHFKRDWSFYRHPAFHYAKMELKK